MRKFGNCIIHERSRCQLTREDFHRLHWHVFMVIKENKLCLFIFTWKIVYVMHVRVLLSVTV